MKKVIFLALACATTFAYAQENQQSQLLDSVFIDSKVKMKRENSGKVVVQITAETLEKSSGKSVAQIINEVSGMEINGSRSNDGQNLGYFVRGGRNRQVVIMLDGVQLTDASQIANDYDLRLIPAQSIESIEIVKGASSVLYGSGAATAVISITTKKSSEKPISAVFSTTMGSNKASDITTFKAQEFTNYVNINGTLNRFFYLASFSNRYVDGLSAIVAPEGEPAFESDVFDSFNTYVSLGYKINKNIKISEFFSLDQFTAGFDNFDFTDANHLSESKQLRTGGNFEWKYNRGKYVFNDSYTWIEREITSGFPSKFDSRSYTLDNYLQHRFTEKWIAIAGFNLAISDFNSFSIPFGGNDFAQDVNENDANFTIIDPYVNVIYTSDFGLNLNAGARLDIHSDYGNHLVYNINPSYNFKVGENKVKVLASYSTAFITPSLFQLYDPLYGNADLQPEENTTIEGGLELNTQNKLRISAVYFNRKEENFVDFVTVDPINFISQYQNIDDEFTADGVEVEVSKHFGNKWQLHGNYTFTQPDARFSLRIPKHKINTSIHFQPNVKTNFALHYQYNASRQDSFFNMETFTSDTVTLESYGVLDFYVSHQFLENLKLFANVSNILDEQYEEIYRFSTRGRNVRLGLQLIF